MRKWVFSADKILVVTVTADGFGVYFLISISGKYSCHA